MRIKSSAVFLGKEEILGSYPIYSIFFKIILIILPFILFYCYLYHILIFLVKIPPLTLRCSLISGEQARPWDQCARQVGLPSTTSRNGTPPFWRPEGPSIPRLRALKGAIYKYGSQGISVFCHKKPEFGMQSTSYENTPCKNHETSIPFPHPNPGKFPLPRSLSLQSIIKYVNYF